ncbi:MAG: M56 family metallopeptidase [Planctomycetes bacterium]|nr:M56 family metallopeptidase [Planctomycetota bacterium]
MPDSLLACCALILSWVTNYLLHSTVLMTTVWGWLRFQTSASHRLREVLWKTALVGGLATASAQMLLVPAGSFGSVTWMLPLVQTALVEQSPATPSESTVVSDEHTEPDVNDSSDDALLSASHEEVEFLVMTRPHKQEAQSLSPSLEISSLSDTRSDSSRPLAAATVSQPTSGSIPAATVLFVLGLLAIGAGLARSIWQSALLSRKLAGCEIIHEGTARDLLDELCRFVPRTPEVQLLTTPEDSEPAALGVRKWTIVLPERALLELSEDELRSLLAHELAHLVRGDAVWLAISRWICTCLAFQPLNHLARREWQRAAEFLCDQWAVHRTRNPLALARCLTEVAGWRLAAHLPAAALAATGRKSGLVDRIESLLRPIAEIETTDENSTGLRAIVGGCCGLVLLAVLAPRVTVIASAGEFLAEPDIELADAAFEVSDLELQDLLDSTPEELIAKIEPAESPEPLEDDHPVAIPVQGQQSVSILETKRLALSQAQELTTALAALHRDLDAAESELAELQPLLTEAGNSAIATKVATRLQQEIQRLRQQRDLLRVKAKSVR